MADVINTKLIYERDTNSAYWNDPNSGPRVQAIMNLVA